MIHKRKIAAVAMTLAVASSLAACSSTGGRQAVERPAGGGAGKADTPEMTVAFVTHSPTGDTFWDIVRKGAEMAAGKDNVTLQYQGNIDPAQQAQLVQAAIDAKVDGLAVTDPNTGALGDVIKKAVAAGIPVVMLNAGQKDAFSLGALGYFGQDEATAGEAAGKRLAEEGAKNVVCLIHNQGQSQLEARCDGVAKGLGSSGKMQRLYANGEDPSDVSTKVNAKLSEDKTVDWVITLAAQAALISAKAKPSGSTVKVGTFDTNKELVAAIKDGSVAWAIDQQPYLQGYLAVDSLWLYKTNGNTIGGGLPTATGPAFVDQSNVANVETFAANGTR